MNIKKYIRGFIVFGKNSLVYKADILAGFLGTPVALLVYYLLWSFVTSKTAVGYSFDELMKYYALALLLRTVVSVEWLSIILEDKIVKGDIGLDLSRPLDVSFFYVVGLLPDFLLKLLTSLPVYLIIIFALGLKVTLSLSNIAAFMGVLFLSYLISCLIYLMVGYSSFWIGRVWGLRLSLWILIDMVSGTMIPLDLLPQWMQAIANALPFRYLVYVPVKTLYSGISAIDAIGLIWWVIGLAIASRLVYGLGVRRFDAAGG